MSIHFKAEDIPSSVEGIESKDHSLRDEKIDFTFISLQSVSLLPLDNTTPIIVQ